MRTFLVIIKMLIAVYLKNLSFEPKADVKPMSNDLAQVMPWQCMFALSMCVQ